MILNDFLNEKLGVEFEDKYNRLAIKEVLHHPTDYQLIYDDINSLVEYNYNNNYSNKITNINYDSSFFDSDDSTLCAGCEATLELYKAFLRALFNNIKNKKYTLDDISYGMDYVRYPSIRGILDPYYHYSGLSRVNISKNKTVILNEIYYPKIIDGSYYGHTSWDSQEHHTFKDNKGLLNRLMLDVTDFIKGDYLKDIYLGDERLKDKITYLNPNLYGYPVDVYSIKIGRNFIKLFTTERGFDVLSIIRLDILDSLEKEERDLFNFGKNS